MSVFKYPAVLENGTYRFDLGGGRFVRATPDRDTGMFFVRCVDNGKSFMKGENYRAEDVDILVETWDTLASWDQER